MNVAAVGGEFAPAQAVFFFRQHDDGAAFGGFVRKRGELSGIGEFLFANAGRGNEFGGAAIAERDGAGFIEQQRIDVARRFDGASGHGQHVLLDARDPCPRCRWRKAGRRSSWESGKPAARSSTKMDCGAPE